MEVDLTFEKIIPSELVKIAQKILDLWFAIPAKFHLISFFNSAVLSILFMSKGNNFSTELT